MSSFKLSNLFRATGDETLDDALVSANNVWSASKVANEIDAIRIELNSANSNIIPDSNELYDLGSPTNRWRDVYLSGNTINLGDAQIKADAETGTIAFVPPTSQRNPNPRAMVVNTRGRVSQVETSAGLLSTQSIENAANTADDTFESLVIEDTLTANTIVGDGSSITNVDAITLQGNTAADLRQYADNAAANVSVDLSGYVTKDAIDVASVSSGATIDFDFSSNINFNVTLNQNSTFTFSNLSQVVGQTGLLVINQDGTGGRTFTLPSSAKTPLGGAEIDQVTTASSSSLLNYFVANSSAVFVNYIGNFQ